MLSTLIAPAGLPLDVAELRRQVRLGNVTSEDASLRRYLGGVTRAVETVTQRSLVARRLQLTRASFAGCIELEHGPVLQVVDVAYRLDSGAWQSVAPSVYSCDLSELPARLGLAWGQVWPTVNPEPARVRIQFDVGHVAPLAVDAAADTIRVRGVWPALAVGATVRLSNSGGALPAPLQPMTDYYIQAVVAPGVYRLAATAGGAYIDLTDAGTGSQYLGELPEEIAQWMLLRGAALFQHRESDVLVEKGQLQPLPFVDRLLDGISVVTY